LLIVSKYFRIQQHDYRSLQHLVLDGGHAYRSRLLAIAFGNVDPLDWRGGITSAFGSLEQIAQVLIEILAVFRPNLPIHSRGTVWFDTLIGHF